MYQKKDTLLQILHHVCKMYKIYTYMILCNIIKNFEKNQQEIVDSNEIVRTLNPKKKKRIAFLLKFFIYFTHMIYRVE